MSVTGGLPTQQDATVAMPCEMVGIDSGSYSKPGVDAVGSVVPRLLCSYGIPV